MKKGTQRYIDRMVKEARVVSNLVKEDDTLGVIVCRSRNLAKRVFNELVNRELNTEDIEYEEIKPKQIEQ